MLSRFAFTLCGNILHVIPVCDAGVFFFIVFLCYDTMVDLSACLYFSRSVEEQAYLC